MMSLQRQIEWSAKRQKLILSGFAMLIAAFYLVGYRPATRRLAELSKESNERLLELRGNAARGKDLNTVATEVQKLQAKLDGSKKLPKENDFPEFIREMTQLSQQSSLKNFLFEPKPASKRNDLFCVLPVQVTFEGDFVNVFSFLRQAESMQRLTRVSQIAIHNKDNSAVGRVQVELSMNIYFSPDE